LACFDLIYASFSVYILFHSNSFWICHLILMNN
jgi:hypothetical protein